MPESPKLTPADTKEQPLYSELPPDIGTLHPIAKAEPSLAAMKAHLASLYSRFHSFGHYSEERVRT